MMTQNRNPKQSIWFQVPIYFWVLKAGITRPVEFARKLLALYAVNVGLACSNCCRYCSSRVMLRCHPAFKQLGLDPFETGYGIVDPNTVSRVQRDARRLKQRGLVIISSATDGWSLESRHFGLGRGCAQAILNERDWSLRVTTKNAEGQEDFDLFQQHRQRVLVGLSTTFLPVGSHAAKVVEPYSSSPQERLEALLEAHRLGLQTYIMLCPLIPAFYKTQQKIDEAFKAVLPAKPEEIFAEVVNPRGKGLIRTAEALRAAGLRKEADDVDAIRCHKVWSREATRVIEMVADAAERLYDLDRLRVLLYPSRLTSEDKQRLGWIRKGVVWL